MEPEGHYYVRKSLTLDFILSQMILVHTVTPYFFQDHFQYYASMHEYL
jgi:hypothetical protein